jgi:hypothetical protein
VKCSCGKLACITGIIGAETLCPWCDRVGALVRHGPLLVIGMKDRIHLCLASGSMGSDCSLIAQNLVRGTETTIMAAARATSANLRLRISSLMEASTRTRRASR